MRKVTVLIALASAALLLASACGDGEEPAATPTLVGDWSVRGYAGPFFMRFTADGTYAIDDSFTSLLEMRPADTGTIAFDGKTLTLTSGEDSGVCKAGDLLVVKGVEFLNEDEFSGVVTEDTCTTLGGTNAIWTRCVADVC